LRPGGPFLGSIFHFQTDEKTRKCSIVPPENGPPEFPEPLRRPWRLQNVVKVGIEEAFSLGSPVLVQVLNPGEVLITKFILSK
jgi:hypothetical protein